MQDNVTGSCQSFRFTGISVRSTVRRGRAGWMLLREGGHAKISASQARGPVLVVRVPVFGKIWRALCLKYDHDMSLWRIAPRWCGGVSGESLGILPRSGMMRDGRCWERTMSAPPIAGSDSGFWPTPKASPSGADYARAGRPKSGGDDLATAVARMTQKGQSAALNPEWVEWLMGWPLGWSDARAWSSGLTPGLGQLNRETFRRFSVDHGGE